MVRAWNNFVVYLFNNNPAWTNVFVVWACRVSPLILHGFTWKWSVLQFSLSINNLLIAYWWFFFATLVSDFTGEEGFFYQSVCQCLNSFPRHCPCPLLRDWGCWVSGLVSALCYVCVLSLSPWNKCQSRIDIHFFYHASKRVMSRPKI